MSGRGGKKKTKTMSKSARAGVLFPVARMLRYLKNSTHHFRVGAGAPVYMAAVIEYLTGRFSSGNIFCALYTSHWKPRPLGAGDSGVIAGLNCSVLTSFVLAGSAVE